MLKAKAAGIEFFSLSDAGYATLRKQGDAVHTKYAPEINKTVSWRYVKIKNFLKQVQDYMGYKP